MNSSAEAHSGCMLATTPRVANRPMSSGWNNWMCAMFGRRSRAPLVRAAAAMYKAQGCDGLIAVGGGSAIDCAKGVAIAATHEGPLTHYATIEGGSPRITERAAPLIAVPTTSGTGSEVARGAIIIVDDHRKLGFHSWHIVPKAAICDPELTLGLPPRLTAEDAVLVLQRDHVDLGRREGPRRSERPSSVEVQIVPPFVVRGVTCSAPARPRPQARCPIGLPARIELSNPVDPASLRGAVRVVGDPAEPAVDGPGDAVRIGLPGEVGRTVTIAVGGGLTDVYGQRLRAPASLAVTTTRDEIPTYFEASQRGFSIVDPRLTPPQWVVTAQAVAAMQIELYRVEPADFFAWEAFTAGKRRTPPGRRVHREVHPIGARAQGIARVALAPALTDGVGQVVAIHGRDHRVLQAHRRRGFGHADRFVEVDRQRVARDTTVTVWAPRS